MIQRLLAKTSGNKVDFNVMSYAMKLCDGFGGTSLMTSSKGKRVSLGCGINARGLLKGLVLYMLSV